MKLVLLIALIFSSLASFAGDCGKVSKIRVIGNSYTVELFGGAFGDEASKKFSRKSENLAILTAALANQEKLSVCINDHQSEYAEAYFISAGGGN